MRAREPSAQHLIECCNVLDDEERSKRKRAEEHKQHSVFCPFFLNHLCFLQSLLEAVFVLVSFCLSLNGCEYEFEKGGTDSERGEGARSTWW